ncbi:alpha-galactosidase [Pseudonocardia xinjiangensis]|uniref:alpha-galactosidase n=1 Tax=Pseudonocardia xinjiangensis TaxID=75289 RepID=UPI003D8CBC42
MTEWTLPTARSEYVVAETDAGLVLRHWGATGQRRELAPPARTPFEAPADKVPLEFAAAGTRHAQFAELLVQGPGGVDGALLRLVPGSAAVTDDGPDAALTALLRDADAGVEVEVHVSTSRTHDVVERWARVRSTRTTGDLHLTRAFGAAWNVPVGPGARVTQLVGTWSREFTPADVDLPAGQLSLGSRQGITSHLYSPVVALRARGSGDGGEAYGVALAWSGSWRMVVDAVPFRDVVRVSGGADDETTVVTLAPGEEFETPHLLGAWSPDGLDGLARAWHGYQRARLARSTGPEHRPIVYNSWYATGFDVRVTHQLALADVAAGLGVEVFVVDDGWFTGRTSDHAGLGDWYPDPAKFPDGLGPLAKGVLDRGMRFGLWVEPEAVNPDSDLFRAHPGWVYRAGDRPLTTMRNQYVLDLGRPEVEEWAATTLRRLLTEHPVSYLKWDMNRSVSDGGRPGDPRGREWSVQHTRAYHRLMTLLREEFPHVTVEACAGGGGRVDNAVLALSDVVWPSDETGPRDRLAVQHGFLSAYPPHVMSSWVTDEPDRLDTAPASLEFRFVVAMAGVLGIGADLGAWDEPTRARARELVALHRDIRPVVHTGSVTRHGRPSDPVHAVQYTAADTSRVVVLAWSRPGAGRGGAPVRVPIAGLDDDARYRVRAGGGAVECGVLAGHDLAGAGVPVPFALAPDCDVIVLDRPA